MTIALIGPDRWVENMRRAITDRSSHSIRRRVISAHDIVDRQILRGYNEWVEVIRVDPLEYNLSMKGREALYMIDDANDRFIQQLIVKENKKTQANLHHLTSLIVVSDEARARMPESIKHGIARETSRMLTDALLTTGVDTTRPLWLDALENRHPIRYQSQITISLKYTAGQTVRETVQKELDSHDRFAHNDGSDVPRIGGGEARAIEP